MLRLVFRDCEFRWFLPLRVVCRLAVDIRRSRFPGAVMISLSCSLVVDMFGIKGDTVYNIFGIYNCWCDIICEIDGLKGRL